MGKKSSMGQGEYDAVRLYQRSRGSLKSCLGGLHIQSPSKVDEPEGCCCGRQR